MNISVNFKTNDALWDPEIISGLCVQDFDEISNENSFILLAASVFKTHLKFLNFVTLENGVQDLPTHIPFTGDKDSTLYSNRCNSDKILNPRNNTGLHKICKHLAE